MKTIFALIPALFFTLNSLHAAVAPPTPPKTGPVIVHEIRYTGQLTDDAASFTAALKIESTNTVATALTLFQGELAIIDPKLPSGLRLGRIQDGYQLIVEKPGQYNLSLSLLPRITKKDPLRQIDFTGPPATIAALTAAVAGNGQELELLSGTPLPRTGNKAAVRGALGADRKVSLRWQTKVTEQVRRVLLTTQTAATIHLNPTVAKFTTRFNYDILQGKPTNLTVALPAGQSITKVDGKNIKNWAVTDGTLNIDFVQPAEKTYALTLLSEQPLAAAAAGLTPPAPMGVERESGNLQLTAEDVTVETGTIQGLRKVNAAAGQIGAWRFFGRTPFALPVTTKRIEPSVGAHSAVDAHLSETRLRAYHRVSLNVTKAGIYSLTLGNAAVLTGTNKFTVANVTGTGLTDWKLDPATGLITLQYQSRVLGNRLVTVELEKPADKSQANFTLLPLNVAARAKEPFALDRQTARITARASAGLRLSGGALRSAREIAAGAAEALAFTATQPDWSVTFSAERLEAIVTAEVFNLATIGDGLLRGSATIRFGIVNQGVQSFTVRVPGTNDWKNVEFAGANIRARQATRAADGATVDWTLTLQEKAWDGYTLVVSYDNQFDSNAGSQSLGVALPQHLERVTGTLALTGASNIELTPNPAKTGLRQIDAAELDEADRGVVNRSILFAYKYDAEPKRLPVAINQHTTEEGLDAVADRSLLSTQINPDGQLITLAAYTVKNTNRQFMGITLPAKANLTYTSVDGESVTPRTDADGKVLVPLPSSLNRNHAFYVEIMYTEELSGEVRKRGAFASLAPVDLRLEAPRPDLPHTGNAWQVYLDPTSHELFDFGGNMVPQRAEPYRWVNVWRDFNRVLRRTHWDSVVGLLVFFGIAFGLLQLALRKGRKALLIGAGALIALLVVSAILMPTVARSTSRVFKTADGYADTGSNENWGADDEAHSPGERGGGSEGEERAEGGKYDSPTQTTSSKPSPPKSPAPKPAQPSKPGNSGTADPATGLPGGTGGMGMGGGGGGIPGGGEGPTAGRGPGNTSTRTPMVQGIRGVRQTIPANGRVFNFTKAIHSSETGDDAMVIEAQVMDSGQRKVRRGLFQLLALLTGLWVLWRQFRVPENRHTLVITGGIAMAYGAVIWICFQEQSVHQLFACTLWTLGLAVLAWVTWYFWPSCQACQTTPAEPTEEISNDDDSSTGGSTSGGAAATAALAIFLGLQGTLGAQPTAPAAKLTPEQIRQTLIDLLSPKATGAKRISEAQLQDRNGTRFEVNADAPFTGIVTGSFANQQKRIESHYQNGQLHGVETLWHENGSKRSSSPYAKGKLHGTQTSWRRDGTQSGQQIYQTGKLHGNQITWHPNGKKATETPWAQGEPHGLARQWHTNGKIAREVRWDRGRQLSFDTWDAKGVRANAGTNTVSLVSAIYNVTVHPKVAIVEAEYTLDTRADAQAFTLFREHLAIDSFSCTQTGATLRRAGPTLEIKLPNAGQATAKVKFLIKHTGDAAQRALAFGIPPALVSHVVATLNEQDAEMELPTGVTAKTEAAGDATTLTGIIGANDSLRLTWKPRVQKAREIAATVFVQNASHVTYQRGLVRTRTQLDYQVTQGELHRVRVQLPPAAAGHKLMRVTAPNLRNWVMGDGTDDSVLVVNLTKPATQNWQLVLELEQPLAAPPNEAAVTVPHALDVKRENGLVGLQAGDDLGLTVAQSVNLTKKNTEDFTAVVKATAPMHVFSYLNTFTLAAQVAAVQPRLEAEVRQHFHVGANALQLTSHVNYTIKKTGIFNLSLALPEGYRVEKVHGANIARTNLADGQLEITLSQRMMGAYGVRIDLQKQLPLAATVPVAGVHPLGTHKLTGFVAVGSEPGLEVSAGVAQGLTEIPAAELPSRQPNAPGHAFGAMPFTLGANVLAYKHITTMPDDSLGWSLTVNTARRPVWATAEVVNHLKVSETHLEGRTVIRYSIKNAPTQEFRIRVPEQFKNVEFEGKNIRSRQTDPEVITDWIVRLQNKTMGTYDLSFTWEWKDWSLSKTNQFTFTGPQVQGTQMPAGQSPVDPTVERETGWVTVQVANTTPLQVEEATAVADPLAAMDAANLPERTQMDPPPALTYQYLRPGWQLAVQVNQFETAAVLQTSITATRFTSVLTQDGRMLTQARLQVVNNGGQTMTLELPGSDDRLWSAFVAGQAVRAARTQKGAHLLPLEQSENNTAFTVEFTYESSTPFPDGSGQVKLESPRLNVPLQDAQWKLHLPRDYKYTNFEGSMTHSKPRNQYPHPMRQAQQSTLLNTLQTEAMPNNDMDQRAYESKTLNDEKGKKEEQSKLFSSTLKNTVDNIKAGNVEDANRYFDQARRQDAANSNSDRKKLRELERQVRQLQALKLNESQFEFNNRNSARYALQANLPNQKPAGQSQSIAQHAGDNAEAALEQVEMLQKSQELTERTVAPLHITLPLHGTVHQFTQSLQMKPGEPMTIEFEAVNTEDPDWLIALGALLLALAILYGFVKLTRAALRKPTEENA
ncbi:MAG: toxin-antitoxin system YwqK family antitoxin [Verrucomicrobia subdivision 3 bacterium]|nr:toxin-antitoxin system YwqK family antitoxin [Limisphaerales bacterium]